MKISDIVIGVEYCETGPLIYGKEPIGSEKKVRVLDKNTGWGWLQDHVAVENTSRNRAAFPLKWERQTRAVLINPKLQPEYDGKDQLPERSYGHRIADAKLGDTVQTFERIRGAVRCERFNFHTGEWVEGLVLPSAIHRTWQEHLEAEAAANRRRHERQVANAPIKFNQAVRDLLEAADLMSLSEPTIMERIQAHFKKESDRP